MFITYCMFPNYILNVSTLTFACSSKQSWTPEPDKSLTMERFYVKYIFALHFSPKLCFAVVLTWIQPKQPMYTLSLAVLASCVAVTVCLIWEVRLISVLSVIFSRLLLVSSYLCHEIVIYKCKYSIFSSWNIFDRIFASTPRVNLHLSIPLVSFHFVCSHATTKIHFAFSTLNTPLAVVWD